MTWIIYTRDGCGLAAFATFGAAIAALTGRDYPTGTYVAREGSQ